MWNSSKVHVHLGLEKPIRILHLTDIHIVLANDDESDAHKAFAAWRQPVFDVSGSTPSQLLEEALDYGKSFDCTVITGDVVDNVSQGNFDEMRRIFKDRDFMFCIGNHEYLQVERHQVRTHECIAAKEEMWDELQSIFKHDIGFDSRIVGGVNLITVDNALLAWTKDIYEKFQAEVAKGYPILVFSHAPVECCTERYRGHLQRYGYTEEEIELSLRITEYLGNEPMIKGFFAGHCHMYKDAPFHGKPNYWAGALFNRELTEITID